MLEATCISAEKCSMCGVVGKTALGHDWLEKHLEPVKCKRCSKEYESSVKFKIEGVPANANYGDSYVEQINIIKTEVIYSLLRRGYLNRVTIEIIGFSDVYWCDLDIDVYDASGEWFSKIYHTHLGEGEFRDEFTYSFDELTGDYVLRLSEVKWTGN